MTISTPVATKKQGAFYLGEGKTQFTVWAPFRERVQVEVQGEPPEVHDLQQDDFGYWQGIVEGAKPGTQYRYVLDGEQKRPDPASRLQPENVHGWSQVVAEDEHAWQDIRWQGIPQAETIIYEIHPGTFTPEGTFAGIISKLDYLRELGINTLEIMPVAQFPRSRNWGYDGVYPYSVQPSYGGRKGLKELVDACHRKGFSVLLDVVYNHLGPEGNYLADYGPYFTDKYHTPWGKALNFDDAYSDPVRAFFLDNALMWLEEFHFDGLRLDAVHAIMDNSAHHFLKELREQVDELEAKTGRSYTLIAESDLNDVRIINPYERGGYGINAQWADDFHHSIHTLATGERSGYYADYGKVEHLAKAFSQGFVYDGEYSRHRKKTVGNSPAGHPTEQFVVAIQNHDQTGNRMLGERLSQLVSFEMNKLAAGLLLLSPYVPLLFMGEEYAERHPFQYFISHGDADLVQAVREGRRNEFAAFQWQGEVPDPQAEDTFQESKLQWSYEEHEQQRQMLAYYRHLISLRKEGAFAAFAKQQNVEAVADESKRQLLLWTTGAGEQLLAAINFSEAEQQVSPPQQGQWKKVFASADKRWGGPADAPEALAENEKLTVPGESLVVMKKVNS